MMIILTMIVAITNVVVIADCFSNNIADVFVIITATSYYPSPLALHTHFYYHHHLSYQPSSYHHRPLLLTTSLTFIYHPITSLLSHSCIM